MRELRSPEPTLYQKIHKIFSLLPETRRNNIEITGTVPNRPGVFQVDIHFPVPLSGKSQVHSFLHKMLLLPFSKISKGSTLNAIPLHGKSLAGAQMDEIGRLNLRGKDARGTKTPEFTFHELEKGDRIERLTATLHSSAPNVFHILREDHTLIVRLTFEGMPRAKKAMINASIQKAIRKPKHP